MRYTISIRRQKNRESKPYDLSLEYESDGNESVAAMLERVNEDREDRIGWQCSCMQKKCGACAMVINHVPGLACSTFLRDLGRKIRLEPLSRFPVVRDLIVDREDIFAQLRRRKLWTEERKTDDTAYPEQRFQAAACLMCGCCLEVCPNFAVGDDHLGAVGVVTSYRLRMSESDGRHGRELRETYRDTVYNTCGKSLSCLNVCPMKLPIEELMVRNNSL